MTRRTANEAQVHEATVSAKDPLWYKDAIVYELHVKAYFDANNDGVGDFQGLAEKLDYIRDLGVNTVWLLPFYPSPMKDDGYDVSDYHNIAPAYGTRQDFRHFVREAQRRGLRIITELVVNHTSDQHPWFQAARRAPRGSSKRNWYVWSDDPKKYAGTRIIFTDTEKSNWTWDEVAKSYYWHRFFSHQPDLNFDNPSVLKAILKTMRFWLDMGVDGFRLDAIPYLCEREGTSNENLPETHAVVREIRALIDQHYGDRLLLAEANQWPEDVREYFGDGDECHMAYHFPLMPRMYMAIAQEDRHPISEIMGQTPDIPENCQWAIFLRNHDELTLEMVTNKERDYLYQMYAADPRARLNLGIRRRLAPLLDNDLDKIKLMNSLLLSMPGSPIIYYGDEIGMGDNVYLGDRDGVRTPMQWRPDRNAGFSIADPQRLYLPPIMDPVYGYQSVNVEAQARETSSLLNWMRRLLATRQTQRAFGRGTLIFLRPHNRKILAYLREYGTEIVLCVANLARSAQPVALDLSRYQGRVPVELMGRTAFPPIGDQPYPLTLPGHGFMWFNLTQGEDAPEWPEERPPREELPLLVFFDGWQSLFRDRVVPWRIALAEKVRAQLEREVLPAFVATQRWYAAKGEPLERVAVVDHVVWGEQEAGWLFMLARAERAAGKPQTYLLPLALVWEDDDERARALQGALLARVRQQARIGTLADAFADDAFCHALVGAIGDGSELRSEHGALHFRRTSAFAELAGQDYAQLPASSLGAQSSNTLVALGDRLLLKAYRRLHPGVNPEFEVGNFLTEVAHFEHSVPIAGTIEYVADDGTKMTLALLQGFVSNQGDAWAYTINYVEQFLDQYRSGTAATGAPGDVHGGYLALIRTLGRRTAELHVAFATPNGDPAFAPEPIDERDLAEWARDARGIAEGALDRLERRRDALDASAQTEAKQILARRAAIVKRFDSFAKIRPLAAKTRLHGDYHLGQVLLVKDDFVITDFEGEPMHSLAERRRKRSVMRDVAGMLRSFNYARHQALAHAVVERPDALASLAAPAQAWEEVTRSAFLDAYRETAEKRGLFEAWQPMRGLIDLFTLEKAFYELAYEADHRPDWLRIALAGIRDLLAGTDYD
ncbi:MAG TPA: maltose alpha-D-glucosyltransferase [Casimicrobiaceae bacterium]|jgi:maltose alpha-D-glucosyltransferase/alpha-amylase|nr:maltose alpha-D-glucosyltransferase [Casimicrobiaceae bacterium]